LGKEKRLPGGAFAGDTAVAKKGYGKFASLIKDRRCKLNLKQKELASLINVSASYISNLEAGMRRPSETIVSKLAAVLGLDVSDLLLYTSPKLVQHFSVSKVAEPSSDWERLLNDGALRETLSITDEELAIMAKISKMGQVRSAQDFKFILNTIRRSLRKKSD
jgi:transcriptional regulator with XRE-family HTH domain